MITNGIIERLYKPYRQRRTRHGSGGFSLLSYKIRPNGFFLLGKTKRLYAKSDALHQKGHVAGEGSHGLKALAVLGGLAGERSVNAVPVLAGRDGHTADGEVLIELVKRCRATAAARDRYRRADLHALVKAGAVKQTVKQGNQRAVGRGVIHGAGDDHAVARLEFLRELAYDIVRDAVPDLAAGGTARAALNRHLSDVNDFDLDPLRFKHSLHLF